MSFAAPESPFTCPKPAEPYTGAVVGYLVPGQAVVGTGNINDPAPTPPGTEWEARCAGQ